MKIPYLGFDQQHNEILNEILTATEKVVRTGCFILGDFVSAFEEKFAAYHNKIHAVGVNSGTDALILSLKALGIGPGDEVITTGNTFITSVSSIALVGAQPVLVDISDDDNIDVKQIEQHITAKIKAILPVHWTGRPCNMERIVAIAQKYHLKIVEDCAQAISAKYKNKLVGTFGEAGCFSLHPYKTLNACGDAGIIITDDPQLAATLRILRHNGLSMDGICHHWSNNSRLDSLQASILNVKFNYFETWTRRRIEIAHYYDQELKSVAELALPPLGNSEYYSVYHTYIVKAKNRNALQQHLHEQGIETKIHYKTPIHLQPVTQGKLKQHTKHLTRVEQISQQVLSLPIYPELTQQQLAYIIKHIKSFYRNRIIQGVTPCESPTLT